MNYILSMPKSDPSGNKDGWGALSFLVYMLF